MDEGVFIGGWKSGRWRQPEQHSGGKFGDAGLCAGRSGGRSDETGGLPDGFGGPPKDDSEQQSGGSAGLARSATGWSGGGPASAPNSPIFGRRFHHLSFSHENPFTCEHKPVCIHFKY
jgi:hypothetical protein